MHDFTAKWELPAGRSFSVEVDAEERVLRMVMAGRRSGEDFELPEDEARKLALAILGLDESDVPPASIPDPPSEDDEPEPEIVTPGGGAEPETEVPAEEQALEDVFLAEASFYVRYYYTDGRYRGAYNGRDGEHARTAFLACADHLGELDPAMGTEEPAMFAGVQVYAGDAESGGSLLLRDEWLDQPEAKVSTT